MRLKEQHDFPDGFLVSPAGGDPARPHGTCRRSPLVCLGFVR
jgi:hypothetical protein